MAGTLHPTALIGRSRSAADVLAKGLGWFSIGLGIAELVAPRTLCRAIGLDGQEILVRAFGVREVATGVAILASHNPEPWIWGRVAGDALDLATVARAVRGDPKEPNAIAAIGALAGVTLLDVLCATSLTREKGSRSTAAADYSERSGFPQGLSAAKGAARLALPARATDAGRDPGEPAAHQEGLLDEGAEETFPGSDPIAPGRLLD